MLFMFTRSTAQNGQHNRPKFASESLNNDHKNLLYFFLKNPLLFLSQRITVPRFDLYGWYRILWILGRIKYTCDIIILYLMPYVPVGIKGTKKKNTLLIKYTRFQFDICNIRLNAKFLDFRPIVHLNISMSLFSLILGCIAAWTLVFNFIKILVASLLHQ